MKSLFLTKVFYFNAAHRYGHSEWSNEKNWEVFGPDSKIHGHNYTLEVMVTGSINPETGFIIDLLGLKNIVQKNVIDILDSLEKGSTDIVIGTQIISKGYHLPNLTLVGVIDADLGLASSDLRASEHTFQLLQQVSGRSGREEKQG